MLTGMFSATGLGARILGGAVMVVALSSAPLTVTPAKAGGAWVGACVGNWWSGGVCVEQWSRGYGSLHHLRPTPEDDAAAAERERRWAAHCRPVVKQDALGVPRYQYAAPGCEFGKFPD